MPLSIERKEELEEENRQALSKVQDFLGRDSRSFSAEEIEKELGLSPERVSYAISNFRKNLTIVGDGVGVLKEGGKEYYFWKKRRS